MEKKKRNEKREKRVEKKPECLGKNI